jgi:hypothetical protein
VNHRAKNGKVGLFLSIESTNERCTFESADGVYESSSGSVFHREDIFLRKVVSISHTNEKKV